MWSAIITAIGTSGAIYVDMTTFLLSALIIVFVNTKEQGLVKQKFDRKTYVKDLADGFSYVKKDAIIRIFLLLAVFLNAILVPLNSLQAYWRSRSESAFIDVIYSVGVIPEIFLNCLEK